MPPVYPGPGHRDPSALASSAPIAAFARWLDARRRGETSDLAAGLALARARRAALKSLVATDPGAALAAAIPPSDRALLPPSLVAELETLLDTTGRVTVAIACFGPRHDEIVRWVDLGPRRYRAYFAATDAAPPSTAVVAVRGLAVDDRIALADAPAPSPGSTPARAAADAAWVFGEKAVLWVRADFADAPGSPAADADIARLMDDANRFFAENSGGRTTLRAVVLPGTVRVSTTQAALAAGAASFSAVEAEALQLARSAFAAAGTTPNPVDTADRTVVVTRPVPALGFGGFATVGGRGVYLNGNLDPGVFTHELGHNHGLPHAHGWRPAGAVPTGPGTTVEYGDPFDLMGLVSSPPLGHWGAKPKHDLGYLDTARVRTVETAGTYRIFRHDHRDAAGVHALRVAAGSVDFWLEHRRLAPGNWFRETARLAAGLQIRWSHPPGGTGEGTALLDARPLSAADFEDAPVAVGETFTDPGEGLSFTPLAVGGNAPNEWLDVRVDFGAPPGSANRNPVLAAVSPAPAIPVAARRPVTLSAVASDPDGDPTTVRWDFDDGSARLAGATVTHRFAAAGPSRVVCSVVDGRGGRASRTIDLSVDDALAHWTAVASLPVAEAPFALAHDGRRWLAAGSAVHTSADGTAWTRVAALPDHTTTALHAAEGRIVAVGRRTSAPAFGSLACSADGETWQAVTPAAAPPALAAVAFGAGRWVAVGADGVVLVSPDAVTWTPVPSRTVGALRAVAYAAGRFVAVGADGIVVSGDGLAWENRAAGPAFAFDRVAFHDGRWIAARAGTVAVAPPDGRTWTLAPAADLTAVAALASLGASDLLALGAGRTVHASAGAGRWSAYPISTDETAGALRAIAARAGTVLAVTTAGRIYRAALPDSGAPPLAVPPVLADRFVPPGAPAAFDAGPARSGVAYQWFKDGVPLPGAVGRVLAFSAVSPGDAGRYHVVLADADADAAGAVASAPAELRVAAATARLANLSVRTRLAAGEDLAVGFVVAPSPYTAPGPAAKDLLLRAAGPALGAFGVAPALADPRLELFAGPVAVAANDDWSGPAAPAAALGAAFTAAGAFAFPAGSRDAALLAGVAPAPRTARLSAPAGDTGEVLAELYDLDASDLAPRLANLSARGRVEGTARPLLGGFVVRGSGTRRLLVRAVGPGLAAFGVADPLGAPVLTLLRDGAVLAANSGWSAAASAAEIRALAPAVGAFALGEGSADSALAPVLAAGTYIVVVTGSAAASGAVLLEIYEAP